MFYDILVFYDIYLDQLSLMSFRIRIMCTLTSYFNLQYFYQRCEEQHRSALIPYVYLFSNKSKIFVNQLKIPFDYENHKFDREEDFDRLLSVILDKDSGRFWKIALKRKHPQKFTTSINRCSWVFRNLYFFRLPRVMHERRLWISRTLIEAENPQK